MKYFFCGGGGLVTCDVGDRCAGRKTKPAVLSLEMAERRGCLLRRVLMFLGVFWV